jgi:hypothetical protein
VLLLERVTYRRRLSKVAIAVARISFSNGGYETMERPSAEMLSGLDTRILNEPLGPDEIREQHARRVWGAQRFGEHGAYE